MKKSLIYTIVISAFAAIAGSASAVNLTFTGMDLGGSALTGTVTLDGHTENAYIGKLDFTDGTNNYVTICADLLSTVDSNSHSYSPGPTDPTVNTPLSHAGRILTAGFTGATTADQQAGLQLAVWSALYNNETTFDANGPHFQVTGVNNNALTFASTYYTAYSNTTGSALYLGTSNAGGQSQMTMNAVPEPASLGVLAVAAIGFVRRRRKA